MDETNHPTLASDTARVEQYVDQTSDTAVRAAQDAADKTEDWRERANGTVDGVRDRTNDWLNTARDYVRDNRLQSVAIALAAGWLIGRLAGPHH